jgi:hypothetical protein
MKSSLRYLCEPLMFRVFVAGFPQHADNLLNGEDNK